MRSLLGFGAVSLGFTLLLARPCSAGEEESKTLFAQGRQLREQGKCAEAIIYFRKSLETYPDGLGAMRNAAECEEQVGRLASARRTWRDLEVAVRRAAQARYEGWERDAASAQQRLASRVPKLKIVLAGEGQVFLNGRPLDPRLLGLEIEQDLGPLEVVLEDDAAVPYKEKLVLEEGKTYVVNLKSRKPAGQTGNGGKPPITGGDDDDDTGGGIRPMTIGGIIALSVGGAALGGMGAALAIRQSAVSDVEEVCDDYESSGSCSLPPGASSEDVQGSIDRAQASSIAVNVLAAVGGAAAGTGIILLIVDATSGSKQTASAMSRFRFGAAPTEGGAYVTLGGAF